MDTARDIGAGLEALSQALEEALSEQGDALQAKIDAFHLQGGLWVGPELHDYHGLDEAQEAVYASEAYDAWFQRKKACTTADEVQAVQAEYADLFSQWLAEAIEDIARRALVWEAEQWEEEA